MHAELTALTLTSRPITTFLPLALVLGVSMAKEALEDFHRFQADREVNKRGILVFNPITNAWERRQWRDILVRAAPILTARHADSRKPVLSWSTVPIATTQQRVGLGGKSSFHIIVQVGDVITVEKDSFFPADLLLLSSTNDDGIAYVETVNLDGESNLKIKKALDQTKGLTYNNIATFKVLPAAPFAYVITEKIMACIRPCA